jgi:hypothetical protein
VRPLGLEADRAPLRRRHQGCRSGGSGSTRFSENTAFATVGSKKPRRASRVRGGPASATTTGCALGLAARGFWDSLGLILGTLRTSAGAAAVFCVAISLGFVVARKALMSISLESRNAASVSCATVSGWAESRARLRSRFALTSRYPEADRCRQGG